MTGTMDAGVQVEFQQGMPAEQRRHVELAIAAMARRGAEAMAPTLAASAERAELSAALTRPLLTVIESDPSAAKALAKARGRQTSTDRPVEFQPVGAPRGRVDDGVTIEFRGAPEVFAIPYHFAWKWHNPDGGAPFQSSAELSTGEVLVNGRAGAVEGATSSFVDAHAGFGISLRTDQQVTATARSLRRMNYIWAVGAGLPASATSYGGTEFTVFENGQFIGDAAHQDRMWFRRASPSFPEFEDSDNGATDGLETGAPLESTWTMFPGRDYAFNVGAWVTCICEGIGHTGVSSFIRGPIVLMTLSR